MERATCRQRQREPVCVLGGMRGVTETEATWSLWLPAPTSLPRESGLREAPWLSAPLPAQLSAYSASGDSVSWLPRCHPPLGTGGQGPWPSWRPRAQTSIPTPSRGRRLPSFRSARPSCPPDSRIQGRSRSAPAVVSCTMNRAPGSVPSPVSVTAVLRGGGTPRASGELQKVPPTHTHGGQPRRSRGHTGRAPAESTHRQSFRGSLALPCPPRSLLSSLAGQPRGAVPCRAAPRHCLCLGRLCSWRFECRGRGRQAAPVLIPLVGGRQGPQEQGKEMMGLTREPRAGPQRWCLCLPQPSPTHSVTERIPAHSGAPGQEPCPHRLFPAQLPWTCGCLGSGRVEGCGLCCESTAVTEHRAQVPGLCPGGPRAAHSPSGWCRA